MRHTHLIKSIGDFRYDCIKCSYRASLAGNGREYTIKGTEYWRVVGYDLPLTNALYNLVKTNNCWISDEEYRLKELLR